MSIPTFIGTDADPPDADCSSHEPVIVQKQAHSVAIEAYAEYYLRHRLDLLRMVFRAQRNPRVS